MKIAALIVAIALPVSAAPIYSIMESNNLIVAPSNFWTNQPNDPGFSNAVNRVANSTGANATNVIIRPGTGIQITTNVVGSDFSVSFETNYPDVLSFLNPLNAFAGNGDGLTSLRADQVGFSFSGAGVTSVVTNANHTVSVSISGGTNGGGSGTVTSVGFAVPALFSAAGTPVTTAGVLSFSWNGQNPNLVLASPTAVPGIPTFRSLIAADIPSLTLSKISNVGTIAYSNANAYVLSPTNTGVNGQVVSKTGGQTKWIDSGSGSGSVTSVGITVPSFFSTVGSPITTSGTIAINANNQSANTVLAGPSSGVATTPGFRALVAGDIPTIPASQVSGLGTDAYSNAVDTPFLKTANTFQNTNTFTGTVIVTQMVVQTFFFATNTMPVTAASTGGCALWNSNGVVYLLTSPANSTAWSATNKLGP